MKQKTEYTPEDFIAVSKKGRYGCDKCCFTDDCHTSVLRLKCEDKFGDCGGPSSNGHYFDREPKPEPVPCKSCKHCVTTHQWDDAITKAECRLTNISVYPQKADKETDHELYESLYKDCTIKDQHKTDGCLLTSTVADHEKEPFYKNKKVFESWVKQEKDMNTPDWKHNRFVPYWEEEFFSKFKFEVGDPVVTNTVRPDGGIIKKCMPPDGGCEKNYYLVGLDDGRECYISESVLSKKPKEWNVTGEFKSVYDILNPQKVSDAFNYSKYNIGIDPISATVDESGHVSIDEPPTEVKAFNADAIKAQMKLLERRYGVDTKKPQKSSLHFYSQDEIKALESRIQHLESVIENLKPSCIRSKPKIYGEETEKQSDEKPSYCKEDYTSECDDCPFRDFEMVGHPGGCSTQTVEKSHCELGFWEDNF
jgi:hypothetical protein